MSVIKINKGNFASEVLNSNKTVLLDFYADWCGPCRMVGPIVSEIANERSDVKVGKINVDEQPELAAQFQVMSIPMLAVIKNGKLDVKALGKQRIRAEELISSLRLKDIGDISQLNFCFLEHNGQISVFKNDDALTLPLIIDGRVNAHSLSLIGKDSAWLDAKLKSDRRRAEDIFLMTSDGNSVFYVGQEKEKKK